MQELSFFFFAGGAGGGKGWGREGGTDTEPPHKGMFKKLASQQADEPLGCRLLGPRPHLSIVGLSSVNPLLFRNIDILAPTGPKSLRWPPSFISFMNPCCCC